MLRSGLSSTYALIADGPESSLSLETRAAWFPGLAAGVERRFGGHGAAGIRLAYLPLGLRETGTRRFRGGETEQVQNRWTIHQLAMPIYGLLRVGKPAARVAGYGRLTLTPAVALAESGALTTRFTLDAAPVNLLCDLEIGIELRPKESYTLRLGFIPAGGSFFPADRQGADHFLYLGARAEVLARW